ncbi:MAG: hypothetical protein GWP69_00140 [Gammaproteobacteria bacterium]|nr:hypothetical protein [Gammaproteobacteria bacterium]
MHSLAWPAILCACLFSTGSNAYFPIEIPSPPMLQVASSVPTAPVERLRTIPEDAKKGVMWPPRGPQVRIDDTLMRLAPGVTIRDMNNRMVLPNTVRRPKKIRYTLDHYGQVRRIWISPTGEYQGRHQPTLPPTPRED